MPGPNVNTNWQYGDIPLPEDFNRIEQNILDVYNFNLHTATANFALESATANFALESATANYALAAAWATNANYASWATDSNRVDGRHAYEFGLLGDNDGDINFWRAIFAEIDTRAFDITYDSYGKMIQIDEKDETSGTVYRQYNLNYDSDDKLIEIVEQVGGRTITYHLTYDISGKLIGVTKEVI